jgi:FtsH-binding integral membrane protein
MLSRLILMLVQLVVAWFAAPRIVNAVPPLGGNTRLFMYAIAFAVIVWLVGLIGAQVLKETGQPSSATLVAALVLALAGAALYTWLPVVAPDARNVLGNFNQLAYPLIGAVIGYYIKR